MADKDREVVIHLCKKFRSRIEAVVEASGNFSEQMYMKYAYKPFSEIFIQMCEP